MSTAHAAKSRSIDRAEVAPAPGLEPAKLTSMSFFCPAYHDAENLPELIPRVHAFLSRIAERFEMIVIEDGSPDATGEVADRLASLYPELRVIHHETNRGYGATLREGFRTARHEFVMYTDGDNQYDVTEFLPHLERLAHADILAGHAAKRPLTLRRRVQSAVYNALIGLLFFSYFKDVNCSMKILNRRALDAMELVSDSAFLDAEILLRAKRSGLRVEQFPVTQYQRTKGIGSGSHLSVILPTIRDMVLFRLGLLR